MIVTSADPVDPVMDLENTCRIRIRGLKCVFLPTGSFPTVIRFQLIFGLFVCNTIRIKVSTDIRFVCL
jgi:hypothetical protein